MSTLPDMPYNQSSTTHQLKYVLLRSLFTDSIPLSNNLLFRSIKASHTEFMMFFFVAECRIHETWCNS